MSVPGAQMRPGQAGGPRGGPSHLTWDRDLQPQGQTPAESVLSQHRGRACLGTRHGLAAVHRGLVVARPETLDGLGSPPTSSGSDGQGLRGGQGCP